MSEDAHYCAFKGEEVIPIDTGNLLDLLYATL